MGSDKWWVAVALASVIACGGRTNEDSSEESTTPGGTADAGVFGPSTPLGACDATGFPRDEADGRPCNWLAEQVCYDTLDDACNCSCPRDRGDVMCVSGLYCGDGGETLVTCVPIGD